MVDFILKNYILIVLIIGFLLLLNNNLQIDKNNKRKLRELLLAVSLVTVFGALEDYYGTLDSFNYLRLVCSFICYSIRPIVVICFISMLSNNKKINYFKDLALINILICSTCFYSGVAFSFSETNNFIRGPLGFSPHILCIIYLGLLIYIVIKKYNSHNKLHTIIISYIAVACVVAGYFDLYKDGSNLFDNAILICILIYYLYLYMEYNKIDALTNTFNRNTFYSDIEKYNSKITSVISIDMNDLKIINDTYGHTGGDKALFSISKLLLDIDKKYARVYRVGGDEFAVLCFYPNKEDVKKYIEEAKERLSKTKYTCSFGYVINNNKDINQLYKEADKKMYKEKEQYHKKAKK